MPAKQRGGMDFSFSIGHVGSNPVPEDTPLNILVVGDFSGRQARGICQPLAQRRPCPVDVDELDACLARLKAAIPLKPFDGAEAPTELTFAEFDDFHPDRIVTRVPSLSRLVQLREWLRNPATFEKALSEAKTLVKGVPAPAAPGQPTQTPPPPGDAAAGAESFDQLLGRNVSARGASKAPYSANAKIDQLIKQIAGPSSVPAKDPSQDDWVSAVDAEAGRRLNAVLHDPGFQTLEAAWRGIDFLIHNLETDETLTISMLDVSRAEWEAESQSAAGVPALRQTPGGQPWGLIVGLYTFGDTEADTAVLRHLGELAQRARAPLLAAAEYQPGGEGTAGFQWTDALGGAAGHVGLAVPRMLLRLPYGPGTEAIESFPFSEMPTGQPAHADYLWGNPALACACLIGQAFSASGWDLDLGSIDRLEGLPAHVWTQDGEKIMTPPAEYWLTDVEADTLIARGLMPLRSVRGSDAIAVPRFQSAAGRALPFGKA